MTLLQIPRELRDAIVDEDDEDGVLALSEIEQWARTAQLPASFLPPPPSPRGYFYEGEGACRRVYAGNLFCQVGVVEVQVDGARYGAAVDLSRSLGETDAWLRDEDEDEEEDDGSLSSSLSPFRRGLPAEMRAWQVRTAERRREAGFAAVDVMAM